MWNACRYASVTRRKHLSSSMFERDGGARGPPRFIAAASPGWPAGKRFSAFLSECLCGDGGLQSQTGRILSDTARRRTCGSRPVGGRRAAQLASDALMDEKNTPQSKIETPPQGWRRAGDAIAGGDKLEKVVSTDEYPKRNTEARLYHVWTRTISRSRSRTRS